MKAWRRELRQLKRLSACAAASGLALGCIEYEPVARYTLVSTQRDAVRVEILKDDATGWSCRINTILDPIARLPWRPMPTGMPNPSFAVEMALRTVPGSDVLLDATHSYSSDFYLLWSKDCVTITGKAARLLP